MAKIMKLTIDFETRSQADLPAIGPWKYAADPSTEVMCLAIKRDDEKTKLWVPDKFKVSGREYIELCEVVRLIQEADTIEAHYLEFERAMWRFQMSQKYGIPDLDLNKCDCTAARAAAMALPRKLETVCEVLGLTQQKDKKGHALMMRMCKPRKPRKAEKIDWLKNSAGAYTTEMIQSYHLDFAEKVMPTLWHKTPEQLNTLQDYCIQDVETEHELSKVVLQLSKFEKQVWLVDQKINEAGVFVDISNIKSIVETLGKHETGLLDRMQELTGNQVQSPRQTQATREWLLSQGVSIPNIQKPTVTKLLEQSWIPDNVREVLGIRQELSKASTSKFKAMLDRADSDNRCQSLFVYCAAGTNRWGGKAIQPQNMVRDSYSGKTLELAYEAFEEGDCEWLRAVFDDPFKAASKCLRGVITAAPGYEFFCGDYSSIEARGNAWQAGAKTVLECFKQGLDIYKVAAAGTFDVSYDNVSKDQRQIGKVQVLALGYQGGIGAFATMGKNYGLKLAPLVDIVLPTATSEELDGDYGAYALAHMYLKKEKNKADAGKDHNNMSLQEAIVCDVLKRRWRADNPEIVASWKGLEKAAINAVSDPGRVFIFNKAKFRTWKDVQLNNYLLMQLPSGGILYYFDPQIELTETPWGTRKHSLTCRKRDSVTGQWVRRSVYGGLICENWTQATCRDILAEAMLREMEESYLLVLHVHDELLSEVREGRKSLKEFLDIMAIVPSWAAGLPVGVEGWAGKRYRKG